MLQQYLDTLLGPLIKKCIEFAAKCSIDLCDGHGKCVNKNWHAWAEHQIIHSNSSYTFLSLNTKKQLTYDSAYVIEHSVVNGYSNYTCRCYGKWTGQHCNI